MLCKSFRVLLLAVALHAQKMQSYVDLVWNMITLMYIENAIGTISFCPFALHEKTWPEREMPPVEHQILE